MGSESHTNVWISPHFCPSLRKVLPAICCFEKIFHNELIGMGVARKLNQYFLTEDAVKRCSHCAVPIPDGVEHCPSCAGKPSTGADGVSRISNGRYELTKKLGEGAFGEVYRARDTVLNRTVALKRIRLDRLAERDCLDELRARFLREAQVAAQLRHTGIVTIYDVVSLQDTSFIVMEYVEGKTLQQGLASRKVLRLSETIHILSQVAEALHHAHLRKVVHRDIKPANILISPSGLVKVADFGIAKGESSRDLTLAGSLLGTPDYMSPEQARGRVVEGRSDLFSLGCIMYECLSGTKPFAAESITDVLFRIVKEEPVPIDREERGLPAEAQTVLSRALAKDPSKRFSSGHEFAQALRSIPGAESGEQVFAFEDTEAGTHAAETRTPDSVADSLMREARRTAQMQPHLNVLMEETRRLRLVASPLLQFRNVTLTPEEAFILSRVDGEVPPHDIFAVSPLPEDETARALLGFLRTGLVGFVEETEGGAHKDRDNMLGKVDYQEIESLL